MDDKEKDPSQEKEMSIMLPKLSIGLVETVMDNSGDMPYPVDTVSHCLMMGMYPAQRSGPSG